MTDQAAEQAEEAHLRTLVELCTSAPEDALARASVEHQGRAAAGSTVARWVDQEGRASAGGAEFAALITLMAGEQLRGLGAVLGEEAHVWAPRPLVRSILEWCADAYWLSSEKLTARETTARALLYDAVGIGEQQRLANRAREGSGFMENWPKRQQQLDEKIAATGLPPVDRTGRPGGWTLDGENMGQRTERIESLLQGIFPTRAGEVPWYSWISEMTHPSATSVRTLSTDDGPGRIALPRRAPELTRGWTRSALRVWGATTSHVAELYGWSPPELRDWLARVDKALSLHHGP